MIEKLDEVVSFGPKCAWLALRGELPPSFGEILGATLVGACSWRLGVERAYDRGEDGTYGRHLFATPPIEGWTLCVGTALFASGDVLCLPEPRIASAATVIPFHDLIVRLSCESPEVHYFATHRISATCYWGMAVRGALVRAAGVSDSTVVIDLGDATEEEPLLDEADEQEVFDLACTWSVDPSELSGREPPGRLFELNEAPFIP